MRSPSRRQRRCFEAYVHNHGHGDLRPANCVIVLVDGEVKYKWIDFMHFGYGGYDIEIAYYLKTFFTSRSLSNT